MFEWLRSIGWVKNCERERRSCLMRVWRFGSIWMLSGSQVEGNINGVEVWLLLSLKW